MSLGNAAPPKSAVSPESVVYVGRQPILDRENRIFGFELFSRQANQAKTLLTSPTKATYQVLANIFTLFGSEEAVGEKRAFINFNGSLLDHDIIELFHPDRLVLEIMTTANPAPELLERCKELKSKGYVLSLDDFSYSPEWEAFLPHVDYVKFNFEMFAPGELKEQTEKVKKYPVQLIAEKVETPEDFATCKEIGFDLFQGYYFACPTTLQIRDVSVSQMLLIHLLNRAMLQAELEELESIFKRDVGLSYRLLCYVNSAGMGLLSKVTSIRHALTLLGQRQLMRFLTLMLATSGDRLSPAAAQTAITRGRFMELLGQQSGLLGAKDHEKANQIFMVGMFSMLDVLLEIPMDAILQKLELHPSIEEALRDRSGPYGPYLSMVEAEEANDNEKMNQLADELNLDKIAISRSVFEAMMWAERVGM